MSEWIDAFDDDDGDTGIQTVVEWIDKPLDVSNLEQALSLLSQVKWAINSPQITTHDKQILLNSMNELNKIIGDFQIGDTTHH